MHHEEGLRGVPPLLFSKSVCTRAAGSRPPPRADLSSPLHLSFVLLHASRFFFPSPNNRLPPPTWFPLF